MAYSINNDTQRLTDSFTDITTVAMSILLASASDIRHRILKDAGVDVEVITSGLDEDDIFRNHSNLAPGALARMLAREKARIVSEKHPGRIIIGADQILRHKNCLLQKPVGETGVLARLGLLRGDVHTLHCAVAIACDGEIPFEHDETVLLVMRKFSDAVLEEYIAHGGDSLAQSVGAYRLEDRGIALFERIEGNFHAALGLPILPLLEALRTLGAIDK
ncbi:MAG: Maf family protein [Hyphomicrobiales bacterium]|nr:Maf family protein [Hyphomicrobiales bacterium]